MDGEACGPPRGRRLAGVGPCDALSEGGHLKTDLILTGNAQASNGIAAAH